MWPFKHKSEFTHLSQAHALLLIMSALTLIASMLVLVKVKLLFKEEAKTRDAVTQMQSTISQMINRRPMQDRLMQPRPLNQNGGLDAPTTPPAPAPTIKK